MRKRRRDPSVTINDQRCTRTTTRPRTSRGKVKSVRLKLLLIKRMPESIEKEFITMSHVSLVSLIILQ